MATRARRLFQSVYTEILAAKKTVDVASIASGSRDATNTITVPGVALGDHVISVSAGVTLAGLSLTAYVSAADTVTLLFANNTGGAVDLASTTYQVVVGKVDANVLL